MRLMQEEHWRKSVWVGRGSAIQGDQMQSKDNDDEGGQKKKTNGLLADMATLRTVWQKRQQKSIPVCKRAY